MIDFHSFFTHIIGKQKIASFYLKRVSIFILNICYYTKVNSSNKSFIMTTIKIDF